MHRIESPLASAVAPGLSQGLATSRPGSGMSKTIAVRLQLLRDVAAFTRNVEPDTIARLSAAEGHSLTEATVRSHFLGTSAPTEADLRIYRIVLGYGAENSKLFSADPADYARPVENLQSLLIALRRQYYHGMRRATP